jgi:hypothetical protein
LELYGNCASTKYPCSSFAPGQCLQQHWPSADLWRFQGASQHYMRWAAFWPKKGVLQ